MSRVLEGSQHPDRDAQFRHINEQIAEFGAAGDPVVSVDAKKKEQLGPFHRAGRTWRRAGDPVKVRDHDFPDAELGKITPYGVYDIAANRGFVSAGTSRDTAAFAVDALRLWWQREGSSRYPGARRLLVTCDAGGSNGVRSRLWKDQLAVLAGETGLEITVCHFPPGTSKWNKIEHRLFCHITRTWRARPLMTTEDAVAGIAATTTYQGLKCTAVLDEGGYPDEVKVGEKRMRHLEDRVIGRHDAHGEWNYAVRPAPAGPDRSRPAAPAPRPDLEGLAAQPGSATSPPCWMPSQCPGPPPASSGCTWPAAARRTQGQRRPPPGSRSRPSSPPPPATPARHALPAARRAPRRPRVHHQPRRPPHHPAPGRTRHHPHGAGTASPPPASYANTPQQQESP